MNGIGNDGNRSSPVQIGTDNWLTVNRDRGITSSNMLYSWTGYNEFTSQPLFGADFAANLPSTTNLPNILGNYLIRSSTSPIQVSTNSWSQVSATTSHVIAIRTYP